MVLHLEKTVSVCLHLIFVLGRMSAKKLLENKHVVYKVNLFLGL